MVRPQSGPPERPVTHRAWPATNRMPEERELIPREAVNLTLLGAVTALVMLALIFGAVWWAVP